MFNRLKNLNNTLNNNLQTKVFNFDLLLAIRGIACIMVVFYHGFFPVAEIQKNPFVLWSFALDGSGAVLIFFILSGYLMTKLFQIQKYNWSLSGVWQFYKARINRVAPLYWSVIIIATVLAYTSLLQPKNFKKLLSLLTFTQYTKSMDDWVFASYKWISIGWSLVVEMQFYLVAPLVAYILIKFRNKFFYSVLALICLALVYKNTLIESGVQFFTKYNVNFQKTGIAYLPFFVAGGLVCVFLSFEPIKNYLAKLTWLLPLALGFLFIFPAVNKINNLVPDLDYGLFYVSLTCLIISLFESFRYTNKPSVWNYTPKNFLSPKSYLEILGHLSYSVYLWHIIVIYSVGGAIIKADYPDWPDTKFFVIRFAITLFWIAVLSLITRHSIEKLKIFK